MGTRAPGSPEEMKFFGVTGVPSNGAKRAVCRWRLPFSTHLAFGPFATPPRAKQRLKGCKLLVLMYRSWLPTQKAITRRLAPKLSFSVSGTPSSRSCRCGRKTVNDISVHAMSALIQMMLCNRSTH